MNYLYIDFPVTLGNYRDLASIKSGDTLEVRLSEFDEYKLRDFFKKIENLKLKIDLSFKKTNDAYGSIQILSFS